MIRQTLWLPSLLGMSLLCLPAAAQKERDASGAQAAVLAESSGGLTPEEAAANARPRKLADLTKGEKIPMPKDGSPIIWNMGPTGIIGIKNGGFAGDQVQVVSVLPGSPAEGKVFPGDVVIGVAGTNFVAGGHLGVTIGNAIIKAEEEAGQGLLSIRLWRDRNWTKRAGGKNVAGVDVDELFKEAEKSSALTEWMGEKQRKVAAETEARNEVPVDGFRTNLTLQLKVMGTYSATSPWDCPVAARIREDAWKVIEATFKPDKLGRTTAGWRDAIALVASGKPEHRELVRQWVRKQKLCRDINLKVEPVQGGGMLSWHKGFSPLEMAIYYDATGDDYVLPEIRKNAIETAMGQSGGGSWGHTFSFPVHNGGQLHGRCPGYGALNAAGSRCFFLLALAKKAGIQDPEIDSAIVRACRFFGTYVDKGCIPYGDHGPYPSDDSNGKNYGAAYAFYVLGKPYEAKYFAMTSTHAAFTPRGGHASPVLWQYTPLSAHIAGPRGVATAMQNNRWYYTMARRHDGSFVIQSEQDGGLGAYGAPGSSITAMFAMYHSAPLKQLIITGKEANTNCWFNDQEYDQLLVSARTQMNHPQLLERSGKPWNERGTDELIGWVGHFYPNMRRAIAAELGKRFKAGEAGIAPKVVALLESPDARIRHGACITLAACGADSVIGAMPKVVKLLDDPAEFVRMGAVGAIAGATQPGDSTRETMLLKAAVASYPDMSTDIANVTTAVRDALFPGRGAGVGALVSPLSRAPFEAGYDRELLRMALERIITMDPGGIVPPEWTRETVVEMAGPIVFVADELQIMDKMFGGARLAAGRAVLTKYGYREAVECDVVNLLRRNRMSRALRRTVSFGHGGASSWGFPTPSSVEARPGAYRPFLAPMKQWLQDDPLAALTAMGPDWKPYSVDLDLLIDKVEADKASYTPPVLAVEVEKLFEKELATKGSAPDKITFCRAVLKDPARKDYFHKMAALAHLVELVGPEAMDDVTPYLGHPQWRLREHACGVARGLLKQGAADRLVARLASSNGETAAGILTVLKEAGAKSALGAARTALKHPDGVVRRVAIQAVLTLGGEEALPEVFALMGKTSDPDDLWGCELALLSRPGEEAFSRRVKDGALTMLPKAGVEPRRSLAWVLAQLGGADSLAALQTAAATTKDDVDLKAMIEALSYSLDRGADKVMLDLAKQDKRLLEAVASEAVRRMVGPNGTRDVTDAQRLDFAEPLLNLKPEPRLIAYLGKVHTGRSVRTLYEVMKAGAAPQAAPAIIRAAEGMEKASEADRAMAADALTGVIEYIEVTKLRGGPSAHMAVEDGYAGWKSVQAQAGKALLKVHKPGQSAIPAFNDKDLDL